MKNLIYSIFFSMLLIASCKDNATVSPEPIDSDSVFTDVRDGYKYSIKMIGTQKWISQNLNADRYRNGDTIRHARTEEEWQDAEAKNEGAWCYYLHDQRLGEVYGKLYNWHAANDPRQIAPKGYHVPSDAEWTALTLFLGGENKAGYKMKSTTGWFFNGNGDNSSGFNGLPAGVCDDNGDFEYISLAGAWWSSTSFDTRDAWLRGMRADSATVGRQEDNKGNGLSIRCVRD
jgi:uncharacterized protein (TIGR02145 family)